MNLEDCATAGSSGGAAAAGGFRFGQQLGTHFCAMVLSQRPIDDSFGLGNSIPVSVRFETEAPVDDILVRTSVNGYVAIQAKTSLTLSSRLDSAFGSTILQFVRHWLACRDGGTQPWQRKLKPDIDRLVIAVSARAPATIRDDLPSALRKLANNQSAPLSKRTQHAANSFGSCVEKAWRSSTAEAFDESFVATLAQLATVYVYDNRGAGQTRTREILEYSLPLAADVIAAASALELASADMMSERTGGGVSELRRMLFAKGVELRPRREFDTDIERLRAISSSVQTLLDQYERFDVVGEGPVMIERKCQEVVNEAALTGSLLIIGEAGTGKSGVLNALGRALESRGLDVIRLAVDQHSVESLEGLSGQLELTHDLLSVLKAWDGPKPGWLVIDALDAARGGRGEDVFRVLIEKVLRLKDRWNVVATIRSYDLKQGRVFRSLFRGSPPSGELSDPTLPMVRHVQVPPWSTVEFQTIRKKSTSLADVLENAPDKLLELAHVPFNTRLIADLLNEIDIRAQLREVTSQTQLLSLYWEHRVDRHGTGGVLSVFEVVKVILGRGTLRAPLVDVSSHVGSLDLLCSDGMLIRNGLESVQFRHHVLFDYAAARFLLASGESLGGSTTLGRGSSRGLLLAPAFRFAMSDRWEQSSDRSEFWSIFQALVLDEVIDPVIRSAAARVGAEFPTKAPDVKWFVDKLREGRPEIPSALTKLCQSIGVLFQDEPTRSREPWVWLLAEVSGWASQLAEAIGTLLDLFIDSSADSQWYLGVGRAARALLAYYQGIQHSSFGVRAAIGFVAESYSTDVGESRRLLAFAFDPSRFEQFGFNEVPAVCSKVDSIAAVDPEFVVDLYRQTFSQEVTIDSETMMSASQILPLVSNAKQDFEMARYHLTEFFESFLTSTPEIAAKAVSVAVEGFVGRKHPLPAAAMLHSWQVDGLKIRLQEDLSYVWAHDPEEAYGHDADALVVTLLKVLKHCDEALALRIAKALTPTVSLGVVWSRLFHAAATRRDGLLQLMLPLAMQEPFLMSGDTRKDAIDVLANGISGLSSDSRMAFEKGVFAFDFSRYDNAERARSGVLLTLFSTIGKEQLVSTEAIQWIERFGTDQPPESVNQRPFRLESGWVSRTEDSADLGERYASDTQKARVAAVITAAKELLRLGSEKGDAFEGSFLGACEELEQVEDALRSGNPDRALLEEGESTIADGCLKLVEQKLLPSNEDREGTKRFIDLVTVACESASPEVEETTEEAFGKSPSWSIPAVRVVAGELVLRTINRRPDLLNALSPKVDALLTDEHPAVRMRASLYLTCLWGVDKSEFWRCVKARSMNETNVGVLKFFVADLLGRVLHESPEQVEELILALAERLPHSGESGEGLMEALAGKVAIIAVRYEGAGAQDLLSAWIEEPILNESQLIRVSSTLREAYTRGLTEGGTDSNHGMRSRALGVASQIVQHAKAELDAIRANPEDVSRGKSLARIIDSVCSQLYFSTGARAERDSKDGIPNQELAVFLNEVRPTLELIAACGIPHTTYQLIEMLEFLLPLDPDGAFDLLASALLAGGEDAPFKYESMGADAVVRLVGRLLADYRWIFEDTGRRESLVRCLEIFVEVGWPSARRLMYGLPEIFH